MTDIPLRGDRAAQDALNYPLLHTNDADIAAGIHHTLGTGTYQAAAGNHTHPGSGIVTGAHTIMDEGATLPYEPVLNFIGNSVWAVNNSGQGRTDIIISGTSSGGGHVIENEGSPLTQRTNLNFVGASVNVTDDAGNDRTIVTISNITGSASGDVSQDGTVTAEHLAVWSADNLIKDGGILFNGWIVADAMTYAGADDPTYTLTVSGDKSGIYQAGQRIKLTQVTGGTKYFIITKVAVSGDTTLTLYGGTDYNLENEAISNPHYSLVKAPFGFPLDPTKWIVEVTDTTQRSQADAVGGTWYNLGTLSISVPIGAWKLSYKAALQEAYATPVGLDPYSTLSTSNNSESDADFTGRLALSATYFQGMIYIEKYLAVASKTAYYLLEKLGGGGAGHTVYLRSDIAKTIIRAVCAYL